MWLNISIGVITVLAAVFYFYCKKSYSYFKKRGVNNLPPIPLFGNFIKSTFHFSHIIDDIDDIYKAFPEDKYVGAFEAFTPVLLIKDPEIIKQLTVKDFDYFVDHRDFHLSDIDPLFGGSLLFLKGQKWRDMRTTLSPAFTGARMRNMLPFMNEIAHQLVSHIHAETRNTSEGKVTDIIEMNDILSRYANDVIASCAFGHKSNSIEDKEDQFYKQGKSIVVFSFLSRIKLFFLISFPNFAKATKLNIFPKETVNFFNSIVFGTMKYREENNIHRPDMLQLLMEAKKGSLKNTAPASDEKICFYNAEDAQVQNATPMRQWKDNEIAGQAFIFFFAGFESSGSAMTLTVHELALNLEIQKKLRHEVDECYAENLELTYEVIQGLKYMDMVISETLRKWSPAIVLDREVTKEYTLLPPRPGAEPYVLKPKDAVYNLVNALHMDPKYFPDPHKFDPERFSDERKHLIQPFTFMPFGVGPRNCIASRFALMEVKVLLYQMLLNFEVLSCSKTTDPLRLQPHEFNIRVAGGSYLRLKSRK